MSIVSSKWELTPGDRNVRSPSCGRMPDAVKGCMRSIVVSRCEPERPRNGVEMPITHAGLAGNRRARRIGSFRRFGAACCVLIVAGCGSGGRHEHPDGFGGATWSRRAGALAFVASSHDSGPTAIYVLRHPGGRPKRLTPLGLDAWSPTWSPNGRWIAYAAGPARKNGFTLAPDDLYLVSTDGSRRVRLTHTAADESSPSWAPNGRRLAYVRDGRIYTISITGAPGRPLTPGTGDSEPQWSPDGRWIAYIHGRPGNGVLVLIHPDGRGARRVSDPGADCPRWSPSGRRIAYRQYGIVHVTDLNGLVTLALTNSIADGYSCDYAWAPNGNTIVTATIGTDGLWHVETTGRILATVPYDQNGPDLEPSWTPAATIVIGGDHLESVDPTTHSVHILLSFLTRR